jgi:hypothetical protein
MIILCEYIWKHEKNCSHLLNTHFIAKTGFSVFIIFLIFAFICYLMLKLTLLVQKYWNIFTIKWPFGRKTSVGPLFFLVIFYFWFFKVYFFIVFSIVRGIGFCGFLIIETVFRSFFKCNSMYKVLVRSFSK